MKANLLTNIIFSFIGLLIGTFGVISILSAKEAQLHEEEFNKNSIEVVGKVERVDRRIPHDDTRAYKYNTYVSYTIDGGTYTVALDEFYSDKYKEYIGCDINLYYNSMDPTEVRIEKDYDNVEKDVLIIGFSMTGIGVIFLISVIVSIVKCVIASKKEVCNVRN